MDDKHPDRDDPDNVRNSSNEQAGFADGGSDWLDAARDIAPYLDLGWRLAGTAAFPPILGYVLDMWLQTIPWILLVGCVFGLSGVFLQLKRLEEELSH